RRGYLRNVAIAQGNRRQPEAVPALADCLHTETEALVRAHAAWALRQIGSPAAKQALDKARHVETDPLVMEELAQD
ncbi:MAG: HEAT repeat domain-containing protein, partial [Anaerolineae bacterium]|nr:HEAT repeat domain-containing protein [Anaerolineae bacterium]